MNCRLSQPPSAQAHYTIHTSVLGTFVLSCVSCLCDRHKWGGGLGERAPRAFREESAESKSHPHEDPCSLLDPSLLFLGRLVSGVDGFDRVKLGIRQGLNVVETRERT